MGMAMALAHVRPRGVESGHPVGSHFASKGFVFAGTAANYGVVDGGGTMAVLEHAKRCRGIEEPAVDRLPLSNTKGAR